MQLLGRLRNDDGNWNDNVSKLETLLVDEAKIIVVRAARFLVQFSAHSQSIDDVNFSNLKLYFKVKFSLQEPS